MSAASLSGLFSPLRKLLFGSLLYDLCKGIASPLMVLLLTTQYGLNSWQSGALLGSAILIATFLSLPAGLLFDRYNRLHLVMGALLVMGVSVGLLHFAQVVMLVGALLVFMEFAAAFFSIGLKTLLADYLEAHRRVSAFSYRYVLTNVAFAIGPLLSIQLAEHSLALALLVAAGTSLAAIFVFSFLARYQPARSQSPEYPSFSQVFKVLGKDRNLVLYTVGSFFNTIVHGRFTLFLSLLLLHKYPAAQGMEILSVLLLTNALVVILLQKIASRYIHTASLNKAVFSGALLFAIGLIGFSVADHLFVWCLSMVIFTLGEIFIQPSEYLYIDSISPLELKGSYFAAHNLANLGAAISPVWCGVMLSNFGASGLCYSLAACILSGGVLCALRPRLDLYSPVSSSV
ncbi:MFS transporter [Pseudomonas sp. KFB-139]|uniref:MFS transporter n=1 Tax=Pseudomonas serbiensis TaxID=3064350 RepID=A0ABT9CRU2_9PSED|nr:MFS transporter [Pseudomonas sp. KFB-138]MDO7926841.1 MFS transporter [Pseudomonas sp. KFB-138]